MLYELREYHVKKGKMKQWLKLMDDEIMPFQVSQGMVIPAGFTAPRKKDLYVWLRRFKNEADRKRLYRKVYESDHWKKVLAPKIDSVLDVPSIVVTELVPTPRSVLQ
jgi:NIPSNAP